MLGGVDWGVAAVEGDRSTEVAGGVPMRVAIALRLFPFSSWTRTQNQCRIHQRHAVRFNECVFCNYRAVTPVACAAQLDSSV